MSLVYFNIFQLYELSKPPLSCWVRRWTSSLFAQSFAAKLENFYLRFPCPQHKEKFNLIMSDSFWIKQPWQIYKVIHGQLSVCCYLISRTMVVGRNPGLNIDISWATVVMALEPSKPAEGTGGSTDVLVNVGQRTGNWEVQSHSACWRRWAEGL